MKRTCSLVKKGEIGMIRKIGVLVLFLVLIGGSAGAFAWWDSLETTENDVTIGVGEGVTISVDLDTPTDGNLVPDGVIMKTEDITSSAITFNVTLDRADLEEELNLQAEVNNIEIGGSDTYAELVNASVDNPGTIQNDSVVVTVTVTLDEPADQTAYDEIKNSDITFDVTFTASQQ